MRVCVTTWYGIRDTLLIASNHFQGLGHEVYDCPTLTGVDIHQRVLDLEPDLLLVWAMNVPTPVLRGIRQDLKARKPRARLVLFNWDDPHVRLARTRDPQFYDLFDHVFSSVAPAYAGVEPYAVPHTHLLPAYPYALEPDLPHVESPADVAMLIGNLYADLPGVPVSRSRLIEQLRGQVRLLLYGPEAVRNACPEAYGGFLSFDQVGEALETRAARVWISTHVCHADGYLNERCILIMGSGNVLVTDTREGVRGLPEDTYVLLDPEDPAGQVRALLADPERLERIRDRARAHVRAHHTYRTWCQTILR